MTGSPPARESRWRLWALPALISAAALAVLFSPVWANQSVFFHGDLFRFFEPAREFHRHCLLNADLPLWDPHLGCGFPMLAEGQIQAFYPPTVLATLLFSAPAALSVLILLHLWLAGLFTAALARTLGASRWGMVAAALVGSLNGFVIDRLMQPSILFAVVWLPLALLCALKAVQSASLRAFLALALVIGVQALCGSPPVLFYTALAVLVVALTAPTEVPRLWRWRLLTAVAAPLLGLMLGAVQLAPTAGLAAQTVRAVQSRWLYVTDYSMPPLQYLSLLFPNLLGSEPWGTYSGPPWQFEYTAYFGLVAAALALAACRTAPRRTRPLWILALLGLFLALGRLNPLFYLLQWLPGFDLFRAPARYVSLTAFTVAALAGAAFPRPSDAEPRPSRAALPLLIAAAACIALVLALLMPHMRDRPSPALIFAQVAAAFIAAALALFTWSQWRAGRLPTLVAGIVCSSLLAADLFLFAWARTPLAPSGFYAHTPALVAPIKQASRWGRVVAWQTDVHGDKGYAEPEGWAADPDAAFGLLEALQPNTPERYGLDAEDIFVALPLRTHSAAHYAARAGLRQIASGKSDRAQRGFLDLLGARYLVTALTLDAPDLRLLYDGRLRLYENTAARPFVWAVSRLTVLQDPMDAHNYVMRADFDPASEAVLAAPLPATLSGRGAVPPDANLRWTAPSRLEGALSLSEPALVILNQTYYPALSATLDDESVPLLLVDNVLTGFLCGAGNHRLTLVFDDANLALGFRLSALALAALLGLLFWHSRRLKL